MSQRIFDIPILYKVLIANTMIVLVGAIAGTWLTMSVVENQSNASRGMWIALFAGIGILLSVSVNYLVLRAAFQPVDELEAVTNAVRGGDLTARASGSTFSDPQMARLAETFNLTLDELERDRAQLRHLATQVIQAQEGERKRVARELHDDTAQLLFAQLLHATTMKTSPHDEVRTIAGAFENMTVEAIESVRRVANELRPPALDDLGLRETLEDLTQRFAEQLNIPVEFHVRGLRDRLPPEVELVLYRVAQEALTNISKHAAASRVWMSLVRSLDSVTLTVDDDGRGFDIEHPTNANGKGLGLGLFGMEERVALVGGRVVIRKITPHGTRIVATIPLGQRLSRQADLNQLEVTAPNG